VSGGRAEWLGRGAEEHNAICRCSARTRKPRDVLLLLGCYCFLRFRCRLIFVRRAEIVPGQSAGLVTSQRFSK